MTMKSILIEGWWFISHSYAVVNQFQTLEFLKQSDIKIFRRDMPYYGSSWKPTREIFSKTDEEKLFNIPVILDDEIPDITYRIYGPFDFRRSKSSRTFVFGTTETKKVEIDYLFGNIPLKEIIKNNDTYIITPSQWSREGFLNHGAEPDRVRVIPHGVDINIFNPRTKEQKLEQRKRSGLNGFVFFNNSAMAGSKGIDLLLKAFGIIIDKYPDTKLVLKGADSLYPSSQAVTAYMESLPQNTIDKILPRLYYIGDNLSFSAMADLYHFADVYVAPYRAEGFNMPVLEAMACGLPVLCTKGGPTDDFTDNSFALHINSSNFHKNEGTYLEPDLDHLVELMIFSIENQDFRMQAHHSGPLYVSQGYTWSHIVDQLLKLFSNP
ncbi:MAG TPA: glycosyl transferase group 1 [Candidatus Margulisbacteria bacterium]|nr:glycosyl transferase group 1 [Candidatus Margulisiibacteriota bacterium]